MFGIPQKRERAFIVGDREGLDGFNWPKPKKLPEVSIHSVLDDDPADAQMLNENHLRYLEVWQELISVFPKDVRLPSFPIWAMEFGANYPLDGFSPHKRRYSEMNEYNGAFGVPLANMNPCQVQDNLPGYAKTKLDRFPDWKVDFIQKNREFYQTHSALIDPWISKIKTFPPSFQKLEWNDRDGERDIWRHIVQFRASGIRVKKVDTAPALVAMTTSQVPIIAWQKRYMTPRECSRLQSMGKLKNLPDTKNGAYKAFGNAVNVEVVSRIYTSLVDRTHDQQSASIPVAAE